MHVQENHNNHLSVNLKYIILISVLEDYVGLINWQPCKVTEPPLTRHLPEDLRDCIEESSPLFVLTCDFLCHTKAVERCVKANTEASSKICGSSTRDGYVRARIVNRTIMPAFETKADYKAGIIDKYMQLMPQGRVVVLGAVGTRYATTCTRIVLGVF
ncbi:hypothetical protein AVEN_164418-1 [Araneus ventricosus]|uniref:Uncharacterized protein n=2 Tax=Araneus ventricosus TaxID=182803 RepID=A0A4Y2CZ40_ARAVE|nr:hypothetical protein AVEN_164418-1 [Araneus ventricosus]